MRLYPNIVIKRPGKIVAAAIAIMRGMQRYQCVRIAHRRRTQHEPTHHREDRRIGADAKRDRQHNSQDKAWRFGQPPNTVAHILMQRRHDFPPQMPLPLVRPGWRNCSRKCSLSPPAIAAPSRSPIRTAQPASGPGFGTAFSTGFLLASRFQRGWVPATTSIPPAKKD